VREYVYDAGALIAIDRKPSGSALARHRRFLADGVRISVPAVVAAQVVRDPARQVRLMRTLRGCEIVPFGEPDVEPVGRLLAKAGTSDVADGFVALTAAERKAGIVTSDRADIGRLLQALGVRLPVLTP
jgi:predicted nucleic acid-binding protein